MSTALFQYRTQGSASHISVCNGGNLGLGMACSFDHKINHSHRAMQNSAGRDVSTDYTDNREYGYNNYLPDYKVAFDSSTYYKNPSDTPPVSPKAAASAASAVSAASAASAASATIGPFGLQTRSFENIPKELSITQFHAIPNQWPLSRQLDSVPSRLVALSDATAKYQALKNEGPSSRSYGSYGTL